MAILGFTKREFIFVLGVLFAIVGVTFLNLQVSLRRARDVQRKGDLRKISDDMIAFQIEHASFPQSEEGRIVSCVKDDDNEGRPNLRACEWGWELPTDPHHNSGARYLYLSNGRHFQIFARLEGEDEPEVDHKIIARNLSCGNRVCNFGLSNEVTPLEKSIEEYENELRRLNEERFTR